MYVNIFNIVKWSRFAVAHGWTFLWSTHYKEYRWGKIIVYFLLKKFSNFEILVAALYMVCIYVTDWFWNIKSN